MTDKRVVLVTVPDAGTAERLARELLAKRLIACANIVPQVRSIYEWEGKIEDSQELLMILKTRVEVFERLRDEIKALHPYKVPEIVCLPIEQGFLQYLQWIDDVMGMPKTDF